MDAAVKPRKPRAPKETQVERRIREGAKIIATHTGDTSGPATTWAFADSGRAARSDVVERLLERGILAPLGDGLFPGESQSYGLAQ